MKTKYAGICLHVKSGNNWQRVPRPWIGTFVQVVLVRQAFTELPMRNSLNWERSENDVICVLRIGGTTMNSTLVRQALRLEPYRMDVRGAHGAKVDCFYYDVVDEDGLDPEQVVSKIEHFLSSHSAVLAARACLEGTELRNLDIALMSYEDRASVSLELSESLIRRLSELHLSVSISTYPASSSL